MKDVVHLTDMADPFDEALASIEEMKERRVKHPTGYAKAINGARKEELKAKRLEKARIRNKKWRDKREGCSEAQIRRRERAKHNA